MRPASELIRRPAKFALIGLGNTLLALVVFNLLAVVLGMPSLAANAIAWSAGIANSFVWNRKWTFADRRAGPAGRLLLSFIVANLAAIAVSSGVIVGARALSGRGHSGVVDLDAIEAMAIVAAFIVNYALSSLWVFRDVDGDAGVTSDAGDALPPEGAGCAQGDDQWT